MLNLKGERAPKNAIFWNFQKSALKFFFGLFFQNFACGAENSAKTGSFKFFCESPENQLDPTKKKVDKIFEVVLKICPPPPPP